MAKIQKRYACQDCGSWSTKWAGRCESCGAWNTLVEEIIAHKENGRVKPINPQSFFVTLAESSKDDPSYLHKYITGISEFDRVCGGGLVPGSVILVGGDPGIGKSTLLLQVVASLSQQTSARSLISAYVSGEEALGQLKVRAERLKVHQSSVHMASSTKLSETLSALEHLPNLALVIIDSIQTMTTDSIESAAGSVSQVRACAQEIIASAKKNNYVAVLVGHVTKEGVLAGPRVLEHMVDTVLYFEGDHNYDYRILRAAKNRFGATDEIGVFSMGEQGLEEITNPSALFLANHQANGQAGGQEPVSGTAIFAGIEGTRPILVEIQALIASSYLPSPRRTAIGWDSNRLSMILAVLESRCGLSFSNKDIYLNVAGGFKITEPAADLAVAASLISALKNCPVPRETVYFGEIGLTGEVRPVSHMELRLKEANKMGFSQAYCSGSVAKKKGEKIKESIADIHLNPLRCVRELV
ncbi:MAG: DNA repair protein RadA [Alphaproteobacteria bacterium]|nr:DNA repair protein RadA [Alphaproteobacteria bacterium]